MGREVYPENLAEMIMVAKSSEKLVMPFSPGCEAWRAVAVNSSPGLWAVRSCPPLKQAGRKLKGLVLLPLCLLQVPGGLLCSASLGRTPARMVGHRQAAPCLATIHIFN